MKAITLIQPWASLIVDGRKTIETRSWSTRHVGEIAIHASKRIDKKACLKFGYDAMTIPRGCILGTARLVVCIQFPSPSIVPDEYGDFSDGRYGWIMKDVKRFHTPIPAKGALSLWEWART